MHAGRGEILWTPAAGAWESSRLAEFCRDVELHGGPALDRYDRVLAWSLDEPASFWQAVARWSAVPWHDPPQEALADRTMPGAEWFAGGTLNYAEAALRWARTTPDDPAVVALSQTRERHTLTWRHLADQVAACRAGLARSGVGRGDRVAAYLPNIPETLVAFLATASLGAVWASCAPEFGVRAVVDRFGQIEPTVLLAVDGYRYGARVIDRRAEVAAIASALPGLRTTVLVPYLQRDGDECADDGWSALCEPSHGAPTELDVEPVGVAHPLYVLFSSGTTGLPKAIVHGHGGITIEHCKALGLHYDLGPGQRFMWFSTTGWMMWNFLVSGLLVGSTVTLFDGDPGSPDLLTLWRLAAEEQLDVLGVSAPFLAACRNDELRPSSTLDLDRLRHVGSTGAPLSAAAARWVRDAVGPHVQVGSMSGGTDVCTAFVGTAPMREVRAGEIGGRMLGCDVRAFRPDGTECATGETGELVIASPMPSMPVGFWGDADGSRMAEAYFDDFPGVWRHGDWITFSADGSCVISGRSDATLNRGGVRLGTADFYTVVEALPGVADSVVVHLEDDEGGAGELILLVACAEGARLDDDLRSAIAGALRRELSPRHVPDVIDEIPVVPRTLSGKKLEVPLKRMLGGVQAEHAASRDSLADPTALDRVEEWIRSRR